MQSYAGKQMAEGTNIRPPAIYAVSNGEKAVETLAIWRREQCSTT
jgi:hypothetical protein